ncbi:methionine adenosyltransferase [Sulfurihydrogenibium subterraneum]|uniref:methionine adenosyltransferase n=1 Tax=Sulfurihydrogenibium subterraneum TaxID=171121 RepID=UPI00048A5236|nr:methionine adenosyltransferase [Sulfurihydrogenibium subterraneum]
MRTIKSAESVCQGHPDKIADIIADAILDDLISKDPYTRASIEVLVTMGLVHVAGEISTDAYSDIPTIVRNTLIEIGYTKPEYGFDGYTAGVITTINDQSPEISLGLPSDRAGDSCIVVGYATNETENYMPLPCNVASEITEKLTILRKDGTLPFLRPDGKALVSVEYEDEKPVRVKNIAIMVQHEPYITERELKEAIIEEVIKKLKYKDYISEKTNIVINPIGRFIIGGPMADTGLTGRKIAADAYGTACPNGGSAFSGKDPTKVDRSASYFARFIAKNIVSRGLADRCKVEMVYAIGSEYPLIINLDCENGEKIEKNLYKFSVSDIIELLKLRKPIYKKTALEGHFGKEDEELLWEETEELFDYFLKEGKNAG